MDNFNVIYKILKELEKAMDFDEFDMEQISAERLKISENRLMNILEMLSQEKYVEGIICQYNLSGNVRLIIKNPRITLKGLEYLSENSLMKKAANAAKGIKDIVPGL